MPKLFRVQIVVMAMLLSAILTTSPARASSLSIVEYAEDGSSFFCWQFNECDTGPVTVGAKIDLYTLDNWNSFYLGYESVASPSFYADLPSWVALLAPAGFEFILLNSTKKAEAHGQIHGSGPCPDPTMSYTGCEISFQPPSGFTGDTYANTLHLGASLNGSIVSGLDMLNQGVSIWGYWFGNEYLNRANFSLSDGLTTSYSFALWDLTEDPSPVPLPAGFPLLLGALSVLAGFSRRRSKLAA